MHGAPADVLQFIETQERPEAPQPAGLAVTLRPYQRQSLHFMLECEREGARARLWSSLACPGNRTVRQRSCGADDEQPPAHPSRVDDHSAVPFQGVYCLILSGHS